MKRCCICGNRVKTVLLCPKCNRGPFCFICLTAHEQKCNGLVVSIDPALLQIGSHRKSVRAPLNYPGNKTKSLPYILPILPYHGAYIEVFGGSAAVLFARNPEPLETYNDRFGGICCFYRVIRDRCEQLIERLELTVHSREEFEWCQATWMSCQNEVERAARWYYSRYYSFGGKGNGFGRNIKPQTPYAGKLINRLVKFPQISERLRKVQIENLDWRDIFNDYDQPEAVFYLDPPYCDVKNPSYNTTMTLEDHKQMLDRIFTLKGFVALSGFPNPLYDHSRYSWTNRITWERRDLMNALAFTEENNRQKASRGLVTEALWIKEET